MPNAILSRRTLLGVAVTAVALNASLALAQSDKPLRLVVPLTTGSTVDTVARALSNPIRRNPISSGTVTSGGTAAMTASTLPRKS